MRVIVCDNYEELSLKAAKIVASQVVIKPDSVLGLATGSTPEGMYAQLAEMNASGEVDFSDVTTFNLDEYYPIADENDQSYHYFMNKHLFSKVNINPENINLLSGMAENPEEECAAYDKKIKNAGGIDLQILGIGKNGHIGFNEPEANLNAKTHLTALTRSTIKANSRFFEKEEDVPTAALTMGIRSILLSRKIVLLASGASKHKVVKELLEGGINTHIPATMLKVHRDVTLICDKAAYSGMKLGIDIGGTEIKIGVVNDDRQLIHKIRAATPAGLDGDGFAQFVADCALDIASKMPISTLGVGTPGTISGGLVSAINVPFKEYPLAQKLEKLTKIPTTICNDATCAALGENIAGSGKGSKNMLLITLGTGIGGGIITDGKVYEGRGSAGEIGHICISVGGRPCPCGRKGCFEQYASVSALISDATQKAKENPESVLGKKLAENGSLNGVTFFDAVTENCPVALSVFDKFTDYLAVGIDSLASIFDPDLIVISGGISATGDLLTHSLEKKVSSGVPIKTSILQNDAGIIGAASL